MKPDEDTYALYDEYDEKLSGGFPSEQDAWAWLEQRGPLQCVDDDGEIVAMVATQVEADMVRCRHANITVERVPKNAFKVLLEVDNDSTSSRS